MNIIGLDVSKNRVTAWCLDELPNHIKAHWDKVGKERTTIYKKDPKDDELTFFANAGGVAGLLALKPDAIVLEPTGVHYSNFWANVALKHGIKILWVTHIAVANFRNSNKLPNKNDVADAYAMACYGLLHWGQSQYFIADYPIDECSELRTIYHQIRTVCKFRGAMIARLRLQLAHEFPESADTAISNSCNADNRRALICFLALRERPLQRKLNYWQRRYDASVAHDYNGGISAFTRSLASQIDDYDIFEYQLLEQLQALIDLPIFEKYNKVFDEFCFHPMLRAILLSSVYPLDKFPGISQFKSFVGFGRDDSSSGDKQGSKQFGTSAIKSELFLWIKSKITLSRSAKETAINRRPNSLVGARVCKYYDDEQLKFSDGDTRANLIKRSKFEAAKRAKNLILEVFNEHGVSDSNLLAAVTLALSSIEAVDESQLKLNPVKAKSSFNNYLISKTSAYAIRLLYKALYRELK